MLYLWIGMIILICLAMVFVYVPFRAHFYQHRFSLSIFLLIPLFALALYWHFGAYQMLQASLPYQAQEAVLLKHPERAMNWFLLGKLQLRAGNERLAEESLYHAAKLALVQKNVFNTETLNLLAMIAYKNGDKQTAMALWENILQKDM